MKIVQSFPPNIDEILKQFGSLPPSVCFTYGDTLYSPFGGNIDPYLMFHEQTHTKQQGDDPKSWWDKYLKDSKFRLAQEVEAYHNQYEHFCRNKKDLFRQEEFLLKIAGDLSSPIYGKICTLEDAKKYIKTGICE